MEQEIFLDDISDNEHEEAIINQYIKPNIWRIDWFGDGALIFDVPNNISYWKRFFMWLQFGSQFSRFRNNNDIFI